MDYFSAFDVDAAEGHEEQKAARHASILFSQRASERFEGFLRQAAHKDEFEARVALVTDDIGRLATEIREEFGAGALLLENAFIERIAGGAFCDDCRKWKNGPKSLCVCGDGDGDHNGDGALSDDVSAVGDKASSRVANPIEYGQGPGQPPTMSCDHCGQIVQALGTHQPCPHCGQMSGDQTLGDFSQQLGDAFLNPGGGGNQLFGSTSVPFRVIATNEDNLGGKGETAVPFSKKKHAPEVPEKSGESQDVSDKADYGKEPDLGKTEDVGKKNEVKGDHTKTWTGTKDMADPVTSHFLSDADVDRALAGS